MSETKRPPSVEQCIADITECSICNEVLQDNRCLPCLHTFCLKCLEAYKRGKQKEKTMPCPVCRREFPTSQRIADLPRNFFIDKLIDAHRKKHSGSPKICEICEGTKVVKATHFCCDCHQSMCPSCERQHKKIKATITHRIIDSTKVTDTQKLSPRPTYCLSHTTKEAELYCQNCKTAICWRCKHLTHGSHTSIEISSAATDFATQLEKHVQQILEHVRNKQDEILKLKEREKSYTDEVDAESANICRELNKLYRMITDNGEKLKKALTTSTSLHTQAIHSSIDKLETDVNELKKHKVYIEQMIHLGNASDLCEYTDRLISETARKAAANTCEITIPPVTHLSDLDLQNLLIGRRTDIDEQYIRSMNINTQVLDDQHTQKCSKDETSKEILQPISGTLQPIPVESIPKQISRNSSRELRRSYGKLQPKTLEVSLESITNTMSKENVGKPLWKRETFGKLQPKTLEGSLKSTPKMISTENVGKFPWKPVTPGKCQPKTLEGSLKSTPKMISTENVGKFPWKRKTSGTIQQPKTLECSLESIPKTISTDNGGNGGKPLWKGETSGTIQQPMSLEGSLESIPKMMSKDNVESVKDACKSLLKECRLDAPPVTMTISRDNLDQLKHETSGSLQYMSVECIQEACSRENVNTLQFGREHFLSLESALEADDVNTRQSKRETFEILQPISRRLQPISLESIPKQISRENIRELRRSYGKLQPKTLEVSLESITNTMSKENVGKPLWKRETSGTLQQPMSLDGIDLESKSNMISTDNVGELIWKREPSDNIDEWSSFESALEREDVSTQFKRETFEIQHLLSLESLLEREDVNTRQLQRENFGTLQQPMSLEGIDLKSISNMISTDNVGEPIWKREPFEIERFLSLDSVLERDDLNAHQLQSKTFGTLQDESTSNPMSLDSRDFESISNMISTDNVGEPLWKREPPEMERFLSLESVLEREDVNTRQLQSKTFGTLEQPMSLDGIDLESISNMISTDNVGEPIWKREPVDEFSSSECALDREDVTTHQFKRETLEIKHPLSLESRLEREDVNKRQLPRETFDIEDLESALEREVASTHQFKRETFGTPLCISLDSKMDSTSREDVSTHQFNLRRTKLFFRTRKTKRGLLQQPMSLEYKASESISNTIRTDNVVKPPCKLGTSGTLEPKSLEGSLESISHTISTDNVGEPMWKREHSAKDLSREVSEDCEDTDTDTLIRVVDASEKRVRVVHNLSFLPDITQTIAAKPLQKHVQNQAEHLPPHRNWTLSRTIGLQYGVIVTGLTILDSKLYTIFQNSSNIEVYDSANFVFVKDIKISGSVNPNDITSCKLFSSLYICDWGSSHIFRVKIRKKMEQTSWSIDGDIGNISVTAEHSILLAGYISSKLKEYNPNGKLLRTITIEDDFKPWHAIRLASSDFIICQGDYSSGNHRVCLADSNGKLIESFGGNRGSDEAHLCGPYHLAVDKSGCILVNDCNNRRILLLSPAMRFIKEIISSSSKVLRRARRMCLDEAAGRLYVADNATTGGETTDGRIQVFSVS